MKSEIDPKEIEAAKWRNDPLLRLRLSSDSDSDDGTKLKSPLKKKRNMLLSEDNISEQKKEK